MAFQKSNVPLCQLTPYSLNTFMLFLLEPIASFKNAYPNVNIEVSEKGTQHIIEHIENNQIDIGLITIYEDLIKIAILERLGISFGPDFSHKNDPYVVSGEIVPIEIINYEQEKIGVGWVRLENNHFSINTKKFLEHFNFHSRMLTFSS